MIAYPTSCKPNFFGLASIALSICRAAFVMFGMASSTTAFAQYEATAYIPNGSAIGHTTLPGDTSYTYDNGGGASAVVAFTASPVPSVSYATNGFNPAGQTALSGGGIMTYRFSVSAQPFTNVPIDFSGFYSSSSTPAAAGYGAFTSFVIQTVNSSVSTYSSFESFFRGDCGIVTCLQYNTFNNIRYTSAQADASHVTGSFQGSLDMLTGGDGTVSGMVQLFAGAGVNTYFVPASATAFIDPHLEINPAFLVANPGANILITLGVGNATLPVPEPASYAFMLAGLAALAIKAGRRGGRRGDRSNQAAAGNA